jgi:hypothetical protein
MLWYIVYTGADPGGESCASPFLQKIFETDREIFKMGKKSLKLTSYFNVMHTAHNPPPPPSPGPGSGPVYKVVVFVKMEPW